MGFLSGSNFLSCSSKAYRLSPSLSINIKLNPFSIKYYENALPALLFAPYITAYAFSLDSWIPGPELGALKLSF
jgi:hypothetical protein